MLSCLGLVLHFSPALMMTTRTGLSQVSARQPACGVQRPAFPPGKPICCSSPGFERGEGFHYAMHRWPAGQALPAQQAEHWTGRRGLHLDLTERPLAPPLPTQMTAAVSGLCLSTHVPDMGART